MNEQFFNSIMSKKISLLIEKDPILAKEQYEQYFKFYPKDYTIYPNYISLIIRLGKFDEAEQIINNISNQAKNDKKFLKNTEKVEFLQKRIVFYKLKILCYKEKYQEFFQLYQENKEKLYDKISSNNAIICYCKKKTNTLELVREDNFSYLFRQLIDYQENDFLDHIKKHQAEYAQNMDNPSTAIFTPDFPIEEVLREIKKYIPSEKCYYPGFFENEYIFKYDENGRDKYQLVDYFKVYTFHKTNEFITITPSRYCEKLSYIDLNYMKKEENLPKIKKLSQIEKFNKKYNQKNSHTN